MKLLKLLSIILFSVNLVRGMDNQGFQFGLELNRLMAVNNGASREAEGFIRPEDPQISFANIAGTIPSAIRDIVHTVAQSRARKAHKILLEGPPGTGKTILAQAIARELGKKFYSLTAGSIINKYQGSGAATIADLFDNAARQPNGAVIFIDEIDALSNKNAQDAHGEAYSAITVLQTKLDKAKPEIVFIAATNNIDRIHDALKNRMPCVITIELPDTEKIVAILKYYINDEQAPVQEYIQEIALLAKGLSCRTLESMVETAEIIARDRKSRDPEQSTSLTREDLLIAFYLSQKTVRLSYTATKILLNYFAKKERVNIGENLIEIIALQDLAINGEELSKAITKAAQLCRQKNANSIKKSDFHAALYYDNLKEILTSADILLLLNYYLRLTQHSVSANTLREIAKNMTDNFAGKDIASLVNEAKMVAYKHQSPIINNEDLYIGYFKELLTRAKLAMTSYIIHKNEVYASSFSGSVNFSPGGCPIGNISSSANDWVARQHATQETTELAENATYTRSFTTEGPIKFNRKDYINNYLPTQIHRDAIIKYIFRCHTIRFEDDARLIQIIQKMVDESENLNCYSLNLLIRETIAQARIKNPYIMAENDLFVAAKKLSINLKTHKIGLENTQNEVNQNTVNNVINKTKSLFSMCTII